MTSTNDGKDVNSNQTSGQKGKTYYIDLYKSLEARLSGDCELRERTLHLCEAWRRIHSLSQHSAPSTHTHLLSWLQRHTAKTVLQTEWQSPSSEPEHTKLEEAIDAFIEECQTSIQVKGVASSWENFLLQRSEWFKKILKNPWGHAVLKVLLDPTCKRPTDGEILEWLKEERGVMFVTRLRQLCACRCDDLALQLAAAVMDRARYDLRLPSDIDQAAQTKDTPQPESDKTTFQDVLRVEAGFTADVWELLTDIEFVLLHKLDRRTKCIELAKQTPLRNGYQLVERLNSRLETSPREKKLWKNGKEVATLIAQVIIARCMVVPMCVNASRTALYCCTRSLVRLLPRAKLPAAAAALAAPAATARHLHTLAAAVHAQLQGSEDFEAFVCELYVRAITAGMNELERLKFGTKMEPEARLAEQTLGSWFTQLGALLAGSERLRSECALTAFSLHPSRAMYDKVVAAPLLQPLALDKQETKDEATSEFGSWKSDSRTKTNFVKTSETLNLKHTIHQANVLSTAILTEGESLGLGAELCQDLAVLLSGPRVKTLSWDMDREKLLENCRTYMERTSGGTRALTTELKYLKLDPKHFQHLPEEDEDENDLYYGIEKGYEHLVEFEPEEIWREDLPDQEKHESASSMENYVPNRRKKKSKRFSSDDETDPLSIGSEARKLEKKKERPHSKERSKEKKKCDDSYKEQTKEKKKHSREQSKEHLKEPKKQAQKQDAEALAIKRERRKQIKKEKKQEKKRREKIFVTDHECKPGSLTSLIGMKVANISISNKSVIDPLQLPTTASVTDSDYDSQGKVSLNSESNDTNILYDGLFSMDELKSPEKWDIKSPIKYNSSSYSSTPELKSGNLQTNCDMNKVNQPSSGHVSQKCNPISDEVKKTITKLLQFRKQKELDLQNAPKNPVIYDRHPNSYDAFLPSAVTRKPELSFPTQIYHKTMIPETCDSNINKSSMSPKSYINKSVDTPNSYINKIPDKPKSYINKNPDIPKLYIKKNIIETPKTVTETVEGEVNRSVIQYTQKSNSYQKIIPNDEAQPSTSRVTNPYIYSLNPHQRYMMQCLMLQKHLETISDTETHVSRQQCASSTPQKPKETAPVQNQDSVQNFVKQLQESINAGARKNSAVKKTEMSVKREIKPISRVTPVIPCMSQLESKIMSQSAKSCVNQKKVDNTLNTFSRLSYMHKNKTSEIKTKQKPDKTTNHQDVKKETGESSISNFDRLLGSHKSTNSSNYLHCNSDVVISRVSRPPLNTRPNDIKQYTIRNMNLIKPTFPKERSPINILKTTKNKYLKNDNLQQNDKSVQLDKPQDLTVSRPSSISERDHNDLLQLLKQQNILNATCKKFKGNSLIKPHIIQNSAHNTPCNDNMNNLTSYRPEVIKPIKGKNILSGSGDNVPSMTANIKSINKLQNTLECKQSKPIIINKTKPDILSSQSGEVKVVKNRGKNSKIHFPKANKEPTTTESDWKSVMNAILSHKTPARSDISQRLSNTTTEQLTSTPKPKLLSNSARSSSTCAPLPDNVINNRESQAVKLKQCAKIVKKKELKRKKVACIPYNISTPQKTTEGQVLQNNAQHNGVVNSMIQETVKLRVPEQTKLLSCGFPKEDLYINIKNSDYDLLEELMDDDLRQEIGEISSDEDHYVTSSTKYIQNGSKYTQDKNYDQPNKTLNTVSTPYTKESIHTSHMPNVVVTSFGTGSRLSTQPLIMSNMVQANETPIKTSGPVKVSTNHSNILKNQSTVRPCIIKDVPGNIVLTPKSDMKHNTGCNSASTLASSSASFTAAASPPTTLQNVVIIGSEVIFDPYAIVQTNSPVISNVTQNTFITMNNSPHMTLLQPLQFSSPVSNPLILGNALAVPQVMPYIEVTNRSAEYVCPTDFNESISNQQVHNIVARNNTPNELGFEHNSCKLENKFTTDDNLSRNCEKKVFSQEQDKNAIKSDTIDLKTEGVFNVADDIKLNIDNNKERIMLKRLAIINRVTEQKCIHKEPIVLTYTPIISNAYDIKKAGFEKKIKDIKAVVVHDSDITHESKSNTCQTESIVCYDKLKDSKQNDVKQYKNQDANTVVPIEESHKSNSVTSELCLDNNEHSIVNQNSSITCRHILLRSSNNVDSASTKDSVKSVQKKNKQIVQNVIDASQKTHCNPVDSLSNKEAIKQVNEMRYPKRKSKKKEQTKIKKTGNITKSQKNNDTVGNEKNKIEYVDFEETLLGTKLYKQIFLNSSSPVSDLLSLSENIDGESRGSLNSQIDIKTDCKIRKKKKVRKSDLEKRVDNPRDITTSPDKINVADNLVPEMENHVFLEKIKNPAVTMPIGTSQKDDEIKIAGLNGCLQNVIGQTNPVISNLPKLETRQDDNYVKEQQRPTQKLVSNRVPSEILKNNAQNSNTSESIKKTVSRESELRVIDNMKNNTTHNDIPQSVRDSIIIEPIQNIDQSDANKCVRIKLPSGRVFKATVHGKMNVDFDTLFSDPTLKSVLLDNLTDNKLYTLNIKQVSTPDKVNPNKILSTRIQEVYLRPKIAPETFETVNLLSDDENDDTSTSTTNVNDETSSFKTEFGDIKVHSLDYATYAKHQQRFQQKCVIPLNRILSNSISDLNSIKQAEQSDVTVTDDGFISDPQDILEIVNDLIKDQGNDGVSHVDATKNVPQVIEIDDSSPDSFHLAKISNCIKPVSEPEPSIIELKDQLLKDLGIDELFIDSTENTEQNSLQIPVEKSIPDTENPSTLLPQGLVNREAIEKSADSTSEKCSSNTEHENVQVTQNIGSIIKNISQKTDKDTIDCIIPKSVELSQDTICIDNAIVDVVECPTVSKTDSLDDKERVLKLDFPKNTTDCFVKITKCDQFIKQQEQLKIINRKCFVKLHRYDESENRSEKCDNITIKASELGEALGEENGSFNETREIAPVSPDFMHFKILSRSGSYSILNDFSIFEDVGFAQESVNEYDERSSPVIDVFEMIAALQLQDYANPGETHDLDNISPLFCDADWYLTKYNTFMQNARIENILFEESSRDKAVETLSEETMSYNEQNTYIVPHLTTLVTDFIQKNPLIIQQIRPSVSIKRKLKVEDCCSVAHKILKMNTSTPEPTFNKIDDYSFNIPLSVHNRVSQIDTIIKLEDKDSINCGENTYANSTEHLTINESIRTVSLVSMSPKLEFNSLEKCTNYGILHIKTNIESISENKILAKFEDQSNQVNNDFLEHNEINDVQKHRIESNNYIGIVKQNKESKDQKSELETINSSLEAEHLVNYVQKMKTNKYKHKIIGADNDIVISPKDNLCNDISDTNEKVGPDELSVVVQCKKSNTDNYHNTDYYINAAENCDINNLKALCEHENKKSIFEKLSFLGQKNISPHSKHKTRMERTDSLKLNCNNLNKMLDLYGNSESNKSIDLKTDQVLNNTVCDFEPKKSCEINTVYSKVEKLTEAIDDKDTDIKTVENLSNTILEKTLSNQSSENKMISDLNGGCRSDQKVLINPNTSTYNELLNTNEKKDKDSPENHEQCSENFNPVVIVKSDKNPYHFEVECRIDVVDQDSGNIANEPETDLFSGISHLENTKINHTISSLSEIEVTKNTKQNIENLSNKLLQGRQTLILETNSSEVVGFSKETTIMSDKINDLISEVEPKHNSDDNQTCSEINVTPHTPNAPNLQNSSESNVEIVATNKSISEDFRSCSIRTKQNENSIDDVENKLSVMNTSGSSNYLQGIENAKSCIIGSNAKVSYEDESGVILTGYEIDDPEVGTCYVFIKSTIDDIESDSNDIDGSTDLIEVDNESPILKSYIENLRLIKNTSSLQVNIPTITYSRRKEEYFDNKRFPLNKRQRKNLKRKVNMSDSYIVNKKYRKSKNINYSRFTVSDKAETVYSKEYKCLLDYCSTIKFSFSRPFHKECINVHDILSAWPIQGNVLIEPNHALNETDEHLFVDLESNAMQPINSDPLKLTLAEELMTSDRESLYRSSNINETNFNMGFGERSDRVIQNLKDIDYSKFSAATLSDVKQSQPFLLSENNENNCLIDTSVLHNVNDDQADKLKQCITNFHLKDKIRSFFKKTILELNEYWIKEKCDVYDTKLKNPFDKYDSTNFPFGLNFPDFIEPAPVETTVQVVQIGQLPVSAAAQNPVTCDPRVTQVSDASPSQCSVENSSDDDPQSAIKTEYTELTTADLTLPLVQNYAHHNQTMPEPQGVTNVSMSNENTTMESEIKSVVKIELTEEIPEFEKEEQNENRDIETQLIINKPTVNNIDYTYNMDTTIESDSNVQNIFNASESSSLSEPFHQQKQQNCASEKTDQIAHAMNAAGITTTTETISNSRAHAFVNILSQKIRQSVAATNHTSTNNYTKTTSINAIAIQQALAQILPPPLNQASTTDNNQHTTNTSIAPQVLHIVQGKNSSGNQITLVDNTQQSVINNTNNTSVLHIVQNKASSGPTSNGGPTQQQNSYSSLSLVDAGLQQGSNQLLHIVNTGNQKNNNTNQLLKRVNLLTNLTNVQGSSDQKMVQFVCKSADGKSIQLNAPHQRSMVLRLQPIETPTPQSKTIDSHDINSSQNTTLTSGSNKDALTSQQEIKSRSMYEENYAKFIQNSSGNQPVMEKLPSLPKFNQAFGKQVYQDGNNKQNEINNSDSHLPSLNTNTESSECSSDNTVNLDHIGQITSPPLLLRKSPAQTSQSQPNLVQQIKQTITPMNLQTMHGGVIYTRQIPVNIGGGQTINLITVPTTDLVDDTNQKQQSDVKFVNQSDMEQSIIKIVPQSQSASNTDVSSDENNTHNVGATNENSHNTQPQPVLTQMRIKLPMLSKTPQMVSGARVVRPSFFQIQRNVIGGANQPVYQQLVLTAAPPLGQQSIRLPQTQPSKQLKVPNENPSSSESQMSSSTLEQLREFDLVLEQVKERSTVQPNASSSSTFSKLHTSSTDSTDGSVSTSSTSETTQSVLYSMGTTQPINVAYVNRKGTVTTPTTSTYVRSPDSSGIADSPASSTHAQVSHTVTTDSTTNETAPQPKPAKVGSKSKSRPKASSNPPNTLKLNNTVPPKTSTQKPLEDEQTTQRILYILAEYKEQVENSPDKDKPAPRRRSNPPSNPSGSSKRKKSSSGSRRSGRDLSPVHGDDTCRTMGSEDSGCGTSQGDCNESCLDSHSPQDSPRKVVRKLTFEQETNVMQPRPQPQRNVIVADGQTITVARGTAGKPATAVLMPTNYILPVSMVKGGQQIAIVTNRGPKILTVGGGEGGAANALLLQRLIGPAGLKPVLARPGVRHVRLPTAALHNLQAFNLASATPVQPPDSTASPAPGPTPPELIDTRAASSPWTDRASQDVKPDRSSSPECSEPWNLPSSANHYSYEETVRADSMNRTVLVVQKKDSTTRHRVTHVSAAALRHKYAILEHELRLQKSLSEECEDLGVDSPSASDLFPEAELLFAASPAHDHTQDHSHQSHTPQPSLLSASRIPQPDLDDQIATDQLLARDNLDDRSELQLGLDDVGIVTVSEDGMRATVALDQEEFARSHPNTTFHSEPTEDGESVFQVQPFTIMKGRQITSTIFHTRAPNTVLMATPQTTVISQATSESSHAVKYDIGSMINSLPPHNNINLSSVLVKDDGLTRFDSILSDSRELHLSNTASAIVHSTGNATQVIRRVCYDDDKRDSRFLMDEPDTLIAGDDAKMIAEDSRDATMESMVEDVDDDRSSPERHTELFWESNSASERSESRRPLDFSSDSDKCCKSPSFDETNSTDSSGIGARIRMDSVIKEARCVERSGSADGSSADDAHPPLRTYPAKRAYHAHAHVHALGDGGRSLSGKTRAGERATAGGGARRRASARGVVKRGCHCCSGEPAPPRPKKSRQKKPTIDFTNN